MAWFKDRIYLDYASATPVCKEAKAAMVQVEGFFGNPGGIHAEGVEAATSLARSREKIAAELACKSREIIFTSSLTESNNLAILGFAQALDRGGKNIAETHWITSSIEHSSVLECFVELERLGAHVSYVDPDPKGRIGGQAVALLLRENTVFISVGWANSEVGIVQSLSEVAQVLRAHEKKFGTHVLFHADAGQAPLYRASSVHSLGVDFLALGSTKLHGPRGIGALYVGKRAQVGAITFGGGQERGFRSGTESVTLAAGFAAALIRMAKVREAEVKRLKKIRDEFAAALLKKIPGCIINGDLRHSLPHMLNISIPDINSEYAVLALDRAGIALSTKAACSEGNRNFSHVVAALDKEQAERGWRARNTLRFSLGSDTSAQDMHKALKIVLEVIKTLPPTL